MELTAQEVRAIDAAKADQRLDVLEAVIVARGGFSGREEPDRMPVTHRFTPGLYAREIFMPAGSVLTSLIHRTEHQFVVSSGAVSVWSGVDGPMLIRAPYHGITKPGTRRLLVVHEDTRWTTFHATDLTDVDAIEREIIEPHENTLIEVAKRARARALEIIGEMHG